MVPIDRELQLVSAYCAVEAAVRGRRAEPEMRVDAAARRALVPAMVLLPMIEIVRGGDPIVISGTVRGDVLDLTVRATDSKELISEAPLADLRRRLQAGYGDACGIAMSRGDGQATIALRIPASFAATRRAVA